MEEIRRYDTVRLKRSHMVRDSRRGEVTIPAGRELLVVEAYNSGVFELEDQTLNVHFSSYASELELVKQEESAPVRESPAWETSEIRVYDTVRLKKSHVVKNREHGDTVVPAGRELLVVEAYNSGVFELEDQVLDVHFSTYGSELERVSA